MNDITGKSESHGKRKFRLLKMVIDHKNVEISIYYKTICITI